jgi:hypothetical protein
MLPSSVLHSFTHGAEPFLKSRQLCSYSRTSQHFMKPEGSLPCSQESSTGSYSEPDQSNPISLRKFQVPNLIYMFLGRLSKESIQVRGFLWSYFLWWRIVSPTPNPKLEDHHLSAVRDCLFNIFAATLHNWRASPPSATWGCAMPWWQGAHLTCSFVLQQTQKL